MGTVRVHFDLSMLVGVDSSSMVRGTVFFFFFFFCFLEGISFILGLSGLQLFRLKETSCCICYRNFNILNYPFASTCTPIF